MYSKIIPENYAKPIALLGGTFDPVHHGHLRMALEIYQMFDLQEVRLLPCQQPVLPKLNLPANAAHRLHMLELALAKEPGLIVDPRELQRSTPSYTLTTLQSLRQEIGGDQPLWLIIGCDNFLHFEQWHNWRELINLAHLIIMTRPSYHLPKNGPLKEFFDRHQTMAVDDIQQKPAGNIFLAQLTLLDISATYIRKLISQGLSPRFLLPDSVWEYIQQQGLYHTMPAS